MTISWNQGKVKQESTCYDAGTGWICGTSKNPGKSKIPEAPVYADIDLKEFAWVIENLLGNVVKYNQTGAIAEDIRPVLSNPFMRGDEARQSKGGTGLGLAVAYKIVEKHGGKLTYLREKEKNVFRAAMPGRTESEKIER